MRKMFEKQAEKLGLVGAAALAFVNNAMAAVPTDLTTGLTTAATDVAAVAGLALLVYFAPKVFKYMRGGL